MRMLIWTMLGPTIQLTSGFHATYSVRLVMIMSTVALVRGSNPTLLMRMPDGIDASFMWLPIFENAIVASRKRSTKSGSLGKSHGGMRGGGGEGEGGGDGDGGWGEPKGKSGEGGGEGGGCDGVGEGEGGGGDGGGRGEGEGGGGEGGGRGRGDAGEGGGGDGDGGAGEPKGN